MRGAEHAGGPMNDIPNHERDAWLAKAGILTEALPYMRRHAGKTFVIKYGGQPLADQTLAAGFARNIVLRSADRRVGKESVSTCRARWSLYHYNKTHLTFNNLYATQTNSQT